jgi:hypothetical protein
MVSKAQQGALENVGLLRDWEVHAYWPELKVTPSTFFLGANSELTTPQAP